MSTLPGRAHPAGPVISPFTPRDQAEAKALILAGLDEHWGSLDPCLNQDLNDITRTYREGIFLVARLAGRLVGTGALRSGPDGTAEIVRMSVACDLRRSGIGRGILDRLVELARQRGYTRLILETTQTWQAAISFYESFGFRRTHLLDGDVYFEMDLHPTSQEFGTPQPE
jgi:ribosomal protein S18 acetylase RimI-like enzyme